MSDVTNESVVDIEATLNGVDAALERLRLGTYRVCESCGTPIDETELIAQPLITQCQRHL
jgi:RNA polymerase-binding transcription factor DksA